MRKLQNLRDIIGRLSLVKEDREDLIKYIQGDTGVGTGYEQQIKQLNSKIQNLENIINSIIIQQ